MKVFYIDVPDGPIEKSAAYLNEQLLIGLISKRLQFVVDSELTDDPVNPTAPPIQTFTGVRVMETK